MIIWKNTGFNVLINLQFSQFFCQNIEWFPQGKQKEIKEILEKKSVHVKVMHDSSQTYTWLIYSEIIKGLALFALDETVATWNFSFIIV